MIARYIFFDLDNTLYPRECGLFRLIEERIKGYLCTRLGLDLEEAAALRHSYLRRYGFTLVGLMNHHRIDPEDYLAFVHEVNIEGVLAEDTRLAHMMSRIPLGKVIVTNGTQRHARRVIRSLGIEPFFSHIFDIAFMEYTPKPHPSSFHKVMEYLGVAGAECLVLDDHPPTLATARELGMTTVYVGKKEQIVADYHIGEVTGLEGVLRDLQLFDARGAEGDIQ
jgi:putative hydrolase of the HAD superfamily